MTIFVLVVDILEKWHFHQLGLSYISSEPFFCVGISDLHVRICISDQTNP